MKILKIVFLNLFLIITVILTINAIFLMHDGKINKTKPFRMFIPYENYLHYLFRDRVYMRKPVGLNFDKKPIILYGCSYSYGYLLDEKDSFGTKLSKEAKRPVYNYSLASKGIQNMLYFLEKDEHYNDFSEPEYVIYTFIDDHIRRLYTPCNAFDNIEFIEYTQTKNDLKRKNTPLKFLHSLYVYNKLENFIYHKFTEKNQEKCMDFALLHFEQAKKQFEKHYPNTKFILLLYPTENNVFINSEKWQKLKDDGVIIYNLNDLTDVDLTKDEYKLSDKVHPNEKAWEVITEALVKKLNLK